MSQSPLCQSEAVAKKKNIPNRKFYINEINTNCKTIKLKYLEIYLLSHVCMVFDFFNFTPVCRQIVYIDLITTISQAILNFPLNLFKKKLFK